MANYHIQDAMTVSPTRCTLCGNQKGPGILILTTHPDVPETEMYIGVDCCFFQMARDTGYVPKVDMKKVVEQNTGLKAELHDTKSKLATVTQDAVNEFLGIVKDGQPKASKKKDPVGAVKGKD